MSRRTDRRGRSRRTPASMRYPVASHSSLARRAGTCLETRRTTHRLFRALLRALLRRIVRDETRGCAPRPPALEVTNAAEQPPSRVQRREAVLSPRIPDTAYTSGTAEQVQRFRLLRARRLSRRGATLQPATT